MKLRSNFRDSSEWESDGLRLSSPSDEACKLYDVALTQHLGWYDDPNYDGFDGTFARMNAADPTFVLGQALAVGLELMGTGNSVRKDETLKHRVESLLNLSERQNITEREKWHVDAVVSWSRGELRQAALTYEQILVNYPNDLQALKMAQDSYFFLGYKRQLRDSVARVIPVWDNKEDPLKSYVYGMYAFGLEENGSYRKAEEMAKKGLKAKANDGWATHALSHVFEMQGRNGDGISMSSTTEKDWSGCTYLACHIYWHWALYLVEEGRYDEAYDLFKKQILTRATKNKTILDLVDVTSLLYRFQLTSKLADNLNDDWNSVYDICQSHLSDHITCFNDAHIMMACLGCKRMEAAEELLETIPSDEDAIIGNVDALRGILNAMVAFERGKYGEAVDHMYPIRYDMQAIGGSDAQRDVFDILLYMAAIKSPKVGHNNLARSLLRERNASKDGSPLAERLVKMIA